MIKLNMNIIWLPVLFSVSILLSACSFTYTPDIAHYPFEPIQEFKSNNTVTLINTEKNTGEAVFFTDAGRSWSSNKHDWAEAIVKMTARELTHRGMKVKDGADHKLEMNIDSYKITTGGWGFRAYLSVNVTTGDGSQKRIAVDGDGGRVENAMDHAMMKLVSAMLTDPVIVKYLTN